MTVKFRRNPESSTYKYIYEVMTCILQVLVLEMTTSRWEKAAWRVPVLFLLLALFIELTWADHYYYYGTKDWTLNGTSDDIIEASKLGLIKCFCCIFVVFYFGYTLGENTEPIVSGDWKLISRVLYSLLLLFSLCHVWIPRPKKSNRTTSKRNWTQNS